MTNNDSPISLDLSAIDPKDALFIHRDFLYDLKKSPEIWLSHCLNYYHLNESNLLEILCSIEDKYFNSWIFDKTGKTRYFFKIFEEYISYFSTQEQKNYFLKALNNFFIFQKALPYDFAAEYLIFLKEKVSLSEIQSFYLQFLETGKTHEPLKRQNYEKSISFETDGIDHLFKCDFHHITITERIKKVSAHFEFINKKILLRRLLGLKEVQEIPSFETSFSDQSLKIISDDLKSQLIQPKDYIVPWSLVVPFGDQDLTLAQISRILCFSPWSKLPDQNLRREVIRYYRSVLKISSHSIIGLGSGVFSVEHGFRLNDTLFYLGYGAILGKGCIIDAVGGAVICSESFLGGGFVPLLIHTHKHTGEKGSSERKNIKGVNIVFPPHSRLAMGSESFIEAANYLDKENKDFIVYPVNDFSKEAVHA